MFEFRTEILARLSDRNVPLSARISETLCLVATAQGETVSLFEFPAGKIWGEIWDFLSGLESLGDTWDQALDRIRKEWFCSKASGPYSEADGERIVAYEIFRYLGKSLYDGDMLSKVKFAALFWLILRKFGEHLAFGSSGDFLKVDALKLLSRQLEYSEENMDALVQAFAEKPFFSTGAFLVLAREFG